ncbi:winged helix DNA-binding domain-containing protein [Flindersiella endophytica]
MKLDRAQVLAYRVATQGLHREPAGPLELAVLDLGVQWSNAGTLRTALAARLPDVDATDVLTDERFSVLWSFRGAPHLLRRADLAELAGSLWPVSEADAMSRLAAERKPFKQAGVQGLDAFTATAKALRKVVTHALPKGEVSAGVTRLLPDSYAYECRGCQSTHVYGGLFQLAGLPAGIEIVATADKTTLAPLRKRPPIPTESAGPAEPILAYLRLHGPATAAEAAGYLGTTATAIRPWWPDDLVEVGVDGKRTWITPDRADLLRRPRSVRDVVRLLPAYDPFLQMRDRDLLEPDRERQKAIWRILGNPGAVLAGGEVVGTWRAKAGRKGALDITVEPFGKLPPKVRKAVEAEAARVAEVRSATEARVTFAG